MKIKVLSHDEAPTTGRGAKIHRVERNKDPTLHPLQRAREYQRALNAVKMENIFAKPFVGALDGHTDAVKCLARTKSQLTPLYSGSCDGEIKLWNLANKKAVRTVRAHQGFVRGMCTGWNDKFLFSCGDDKAIKQWSVRDFENELVETLEPRQTFHASSMLMSVDHHWRQSLLVTAGETVDVWDHHRSVPLHSFEWGCDVVLSSKFNPAENCLIGSTGADCSIGLYDLRGSSAIRKIMMKNRSNALAWNPRQPMNFTVANEDSNLYTFDMRKLDKALQVHQDHVMAVLDLDYSMDGTEFVSASYDCTVRIFKADAPRSREIYHTKRMQRVLGVKFSADTRFVFSASEDTNVRVWKSVRHQKLGNVSTREKIAIDYRESLKKKFKDLPEIKRISRHRHVPKLVKSMTDTRSVVKHSKYRKEQNVIKVSKGKTKKADQKKKPIIRQEA